MLQTTCNIRCHSVLVFGWYFRFIGSFPNTSDLADLRIAFLLLSFPTAPGSFGVKKAGDQAKAGSL